MENLKMRAISDSAQDWAKELHASLKGREAESASEARFIKVNNYRELTEAEEELLVSDAEETRRACHERNMKRMSAMNRRVQRLAR